MSNRKPPSRLTFTRNAAATVLIGLMLALSANASTGSGYAFIDSVAAFFGMTTENSAETEQAMEPNGAPAVEPMFFLDSPILTWNTFGNTGSETTEPSTTNTNV